MRPMQPALQMMRMQLVVLKELQPARSALAGAAQEHAIHLQQQLWQLRMP